jgi:hypothetical protein
MTTRSYNNAIAAHEVSVAIERFLIAPYPQTFTPARIDLGNLPAGYIDLGAVVEDSVTVTMSREKYQLITGLPRVIQYQAIMGVTGKIEFSLWSNSYHKVQFALGSGWHTYSGVTTTSITTLTTIASGEVFTQYLGTKDINYYALLGVANFIDGTDVYHEFGKVSPADDWQESFKPDAAGQVPLSFDALGYETTLGSCTELIIGKRHYINNLGVTCIT